MSRSLFAKALDAALRPIGFERNKDDWTRIRGDFEATINRQSSWLGGVAVNCALKDLVTERLYLEIFPEAVVFPVPYRRMGEFIEGHDGWWATEDPDAAADMATAVLNNVIPWFEQPWPLEVQAREWYFRERQLERLRGGGGFGAIGLVLTLHRMGEFDDVRKLLNAPTPRTAIESNVKNFARVREYLGYA
ncbi:DUF4304 domain-containing protein [Phenylobacterium immobile]|uniref:DUF4304 domain-containing protein n=1 Tax=Phenylobacterium immobile TaxID=21 RepID=UPI000ABECA81|nr:DUF4304 domain-containing protein [Phenylobacterium immobile]